MNRYSNLFFLIIILFLTIFMIINPRETVVAANSGFKLWYSIIVPALLPFFIVAELLVSLGLVRFLGILLEPVMRPIFRLPGSSSLVLVMGFTSGFPVGALLSKRLFDEGLLKISEAERLICFTNNSSPLFIIGAVGVGMFGAPEIGYLLAFSHYMANLIVGVLWRFKSDLPLSSSHLSIHSWRKVCQSISFKPTSIGELLGEAIKNSLNQLIAIAGFIVIFSVLARMLSVWGILDIFAQLLSFLGLSYSTSYGLGMGLFEITIGAKTVAMSQGELMEKLILVSIIMAFSGFSIIAQVMSIASQIPVRLSFYLLSRLVQMIFSAVITFIGYKLVLTRLNLIPSFSFPYYKVLYSFDVWNFSLSCLAIGLVLIAMMMVFSLVYHH